MFVKGTFQAAGILLILAILTLLFGYLLVSSIIFLALVLLLQFFRDPDRTIPSVEGLVVASADGRRLNGKIDLIKTVNCEDPMMRYVLAKGEKGILISTYMSGLDVHVNRVPISGKIILTRHYPGKFKFARGDVEHVNEKNLIVIDSEYGKIGVIQIAGFVARRIVQYVNEGDTVKTGERLGMIRFGSRVNLIIPHDNSQLMVDEGEKPTAGETIVAKMLKKDL